MSELPDNRVVGAGRELDEPSLVDGVAELVERLEAGEPVDLSALRETHPVQAEELRRILPTIRRLASFGRAYPASSPRVADATARVRSEPELGRLGDFRLLREVGRGGMGVVYEAEQISLGRRVALKVLPLAAALDPRNHQRFLLEARAAACLHHAHIVPVHAVGSERGAPYYAMQFIDGCTLAQVLEQLRGGRGGAVSSWIGPTEPPGPTDRDAPTDPPVSAPIPATTLGASNRDRAYSRAMAEHALRAAEALDHAHGRGILHRDIKPANLMLDVEGHLWITDFGLAQIQGDSRLTLTGDVVGTLRYMSPEQALARRVVIDGRTDIYSLGATLYELLTLRPVFEGADRTEILRKIAQDEPTPIRKLNPDVPRDLETIVQKCLAKDPADRYATARDLADDLGRFLGGRTIAARPPGWAERSARWARRHRAVVAPAALFLALALVGLGGTLVWSNNWLRIHGDRLQAERDRAERLSRELEAQRDLAEHRRRIADHHLYAFLLRQAAEAFRAGQLEKTQVILRDARPEPGEDDLREFAWHHLWRQSRREVALISERNDQVNALAISPDGRVVAVGDLDGPVSLRDAGSGVLLRRLDAHKVPVIGLAFSPDGRRLASSTGFGPDSRANRRGEVILWDAATGDLLARLQGLRGRAIANVRFDRTGDYLWERSLAPGGEFENGLWRLGRDVGALRPVLIGRWRGGQDFPVAAGPLRIAWIEEGGRDVSVANAPTGRVLCRLPRSQHGYRNVALSQDGRLVAAAEVAAPGSVLKLTVHNVETGRLLAERPDGPGGASLDLLEIGADGRFLVAQGIEGALRQYDLRTGEMWTLHSNPSDRGHSHSDATLIPGGRSLAWHYQGEISGSRPMEIYDRTNGALRATFPGRSEPSRNGVGHPDGRSLLFQSRAQALIWHFEPAVDPQPAGHSDEAWTAAYSPDGRTLATGSDDTDEPLTLKLWDVDSGRLLRGWKPHPATTGAVAFQPGGRIMATAALTSEQNLRLWDADSGRLLATLDGHTERVRTVAFSPDGRRLASAGSDRTIRVWDPAERRCLRTLVGHSDAVRQVAFSPDGNTLASVGNDRSVRLWDGEADRPTWVWEGGLKITSAAFSPDGRTLVWAHEDGVIMGWDRVGKTLLLPPMHSEHDELRCLAFSPDGRTLAAGGRSGKIHLWDPVAAQELLALDGRPRQVNALAFSPDGSTLAACWHDGTVRIVRSRHDSPVPARQSFSP